MSRFLDLPHCLPEVRSLKEQRLIESASSGDAETFCPLFKECMFGGVGMISDKILYPALQIAARHGHTNIVDLMISMISDHNAGNLLMWFWPVQGVFMTSSPIHLAVREGHQKVVTALLQCLFSRVNLPSNGSKGVDDVYVQDLVAWAVRWGHASVVRLLLLFLHKLFVNGRILPSGLPSGLLQLAAHHSHVEVLSVLLRESSSLPVDRVWLDWSRPTDGLTPLHLAAQSGSVAAVKLLLEEGFSINSRSAPDLFTPLHMAANSGHVEVVSLLLQTPSCDSPAQPQQRPIHMEKPSESLKEEAYINLDQILARDCLGRTALHYAVREGHVHVVRRLLCCAQQMQVNLASIADHDGVLSLHLAARSGHIGLIRELTSAHADGISTKAKDSAHMKGRVEMEYMLEREANCYYGERCEFPRPRLVDSFFWKTEGFTPLHFATRYGHEIDVRELLEQSKEDASRMLQNVEDHGLREQAIFCKRSLDAEKKAMVELLHSWHKGTRPPLRAHIVQWLEGTEIGSVRRYWLSRAVKTGDLDLLKRLLVLLADFEAIDGNNTEYDCWALHNKIVREAFHELVYSVGSSSWVLGKIPSKICYTAVSKSRVSDPAAGRRVNEITSEVMTRELLLHLPAVEVHEAVRFLCDALHAESYGVAKGILLQVPQVALLDNTVARTAEQWIIEAPNRSFRRGKSFLMALAMREGLVGAPRLLRRMLTRAQGVGRMEDLVEVIMDRPELKKGLYEDRQVYLDCANAILLGAALIVGIAVQGWLQPPLGYSYTYEEEQYVDVQKPLMRVFWKFNNAAFFLAVGALVAGAKGSVPVARDTDILQSVEKVKRAVAVAGTFLGGALVCLVVAFSAAGFVVLPPRGTDFRMMRNGVIWGAVPCGLALLWFYWSVLPLLLPYLCCVLSPLRCVLSTLTFLFRAFRFLIFESIYDFCRRSFKGCIRQCMRYIHQQF